MILRQKGQKLGREICMYLTENRLSRNEMLCAAHNHNDMCHICEKKDFRFEL